MRRIVKRMAVVMMLGLVVVLAGCRRRSRNTVVASPDDDIFTTDAFPGAPVQQGNVADDLRAFSNSGESRSQLVTVFNGDRGTAIAMYATKGTEPTAPFHLYAHYFDGATWTPPVALEAPDVDWTKSAGFSSISFLNTASHPAASARERDGDAIIVWKASDTDGDGALIADGTNECLYATYFDVTHAAEPDHRYGFQKTATRLNVQDMLSEDILDDGVVTDGLQGETRFGSPLNSYRFGQETTGLAVCWVQREDNDISNPNVEDQALWVARYDLASGADPEVPLVPDPSVRVPILGFGASDSGISSEETLVDQVLVTYNNVLFFRVASKQTAGSDIPSNNFAPQSLGIKYGTKMYDGDDVTLQYIAFDFLAGSFAGPFTLSAGPPDSTDASESNMMFLLTNGLNGNTTFRDSPSVYGSDEGLAQLEIVFCELANDPDGATDFGSGFQDGVLEMRGIDEATGAPQGGVLLSNDDPTIFDTVSYGDVTTRLSRNGDYLWIAWLQSDAAGASDDTAVRVAQFVTTRPADDGTFVLPPVSLATSLTFTPGSDLDGFGVQWIAFQDGLGYVCGSQSDPDVMNLFFEHSDLTHDQVFQVRLTASHLVPPMPAVSTTPLESFGEGDLDSNTFGIHDNQANFSAVDSGEGGNVFAVFREDIDPSPNGDFRLFARRTGMGAGKVEIGSGAGGLQVPQQALQLVVTPPGGNIGVFDTATGEDSPDRPHPAEFVHVLFFEDRYAHLSPTSYALRTRNFDARDATLSLGEAMSPSAGTAFLPPFDLELPNLDPDKFDAPDVIGTARDGNTLGLWFQELSHLYYQEFDGESLAWRTLDGVGDPALIDDDSPVDVEPGATLFRHNGSCNDLHGAALFWAKELDGGSGEKRFQVRVRD